MINFISEEKKKKSKLNKKVLLASALLPLAVMTSDLPAIGALPAFASTVTPMIASSTDFTVVLRDDGTVWVYGNNEWGQAGNGTTSNYTSPTMVPGLTNVIQVAAGYNYVLALKSDGTVWAWGNNNYGQLGNGTNTSSNTPVQVSGLAGITSIASTTNGFTGYALKSDGSVWSWGYSGDGELGNGGTTNTNTPAQISGLSGISSIAAGNAFAFAVDNAGKGYSWGVNSSGQLGLGYTSSTPIKTPASISGLTGISKIFAGNSFAMALDSGNNVWAWGYNGYGNYGNGGTTEFSSPTKVTQWGTNVAAMSLGNNGQTFVLNKDGSVYASGNNSYGEFDDGNTTSTTTPVKANDLSGVIAISNDLDSSLTAVKSDGSIWSVGYQNIYEQFANNSTSPSTTPVEALGITMTGQPSPYNLTATGTTTTSTTLSWNTPDGAVSFNIYQNGAKIASNVSGTSYQVTGLSPAGYYNFTITEVVNGVESPQSYPVSVSTQLVLKQNNVKISGDYGHTLILKPDGTVWAVGDNSYGELGDGTTTSSLVPTQVSGLSNIISVAAGQYNSFALDSSGNVWAWGSNSGGSLGIGSSVSTQLIPIKVATLSNIVQISATSGALLALRNDGTVWICGENNYGQLGQGSTSPSSSNIPLQVKNLSNVVAITSGENWSLALEKDGSLWGWGYDANGELGTGTASTSVTLPIKASISDVVGIASGNGTYALKSDGTVWAWGDGYLGYSSGTAQTNNPTQITTLPSNIAKIQANQDTILAYGKDGSLWGWGANSFGQLGIGSTSAVYEPIQIESSALDIGVAPHSSYFVKSDGSLWGSGANSSGMLDQGSTSPSYYASPVEFSGINLTPLPSAPTGLTQTVTTDTYVDLSWNADASASSYNVYQNGTEIATGVTNPNYSVTGLTPSTAYNFTVTAIVGGVESAQSSALAVTTKSSPPTGLVTSNVTQNGVSLSWGAVTGATSYNVYQNGTLITSPTTTNYDVTGLTSGTAYNYSISAVISGVESALSTPVEITTIPSAPTNLTSSNVSQTGVTLGWDSVGSTVTYDVYQNGSPIATSVAQDTYDVTGLNANTTYTFTVIANTSGGASPASSPISVTTLMNAPAGAPNGLTASNVTSTSAKLNWQTVADAVYYDVYQNGSPIATSVTQDTYDVTNLSPSTSYDFTVDARNAEGTSAQSNVFTLTTAPSTSGTGSTGGTSSPVTASDITAISLSLSWNTVSNAVYYDVYQDGTLIAT